MAIFLDSGKIEEVRKYMTWGVIRGVTTNPTGVTGGVEGMKRRAKEIADLIQPYPLSLEVTSNDRGHMIAQAKEFAAIANNIKITVHGPRGETENLETVTTCG